MISAIRFTGNGPKPGDNFKIKLSSRVGQPLDHQEIKDDFKTLMDTKWFSDVQVSYEDIPPKSGKLILTFVVHAKPR